MQHSQSQLSLSSSSYCHNISAENYFLSPKMPVKDHINAFRSTNTSFKPNQNQVYLCLLKKPKGILEKVDMNDCDKSVVLTRNIQSLSQMNLLK